MLMSAIIGSGLRRGGIGASAISLVQHADGKTGQAAQAGQQIDKPLRCDLGRKA